MITQLAHACIFSRDLDKTLHFYTTVLGLKKKFNFLRAGKVIGFYLEISPTQFIEVFLRNEQADAKIPGIGHLCFEVPNIHQARAKLLQHDCKATDPRLGADESWQIWSEDPDGVPLEFHQYTGKSSQATGADCEVNW